MALLGDPWRGPSTAETGDPAPLTETDVTWVNPRAFGAGKLLSGNARVKVIPENLSLIWANCNKFSFLRGRAVRRNILIIVTIQPDQQQ
jgi:hypothetical protein